MIQKFKLNISTTSCSNEEERMSLSYKFKYKTFCGETIINFNYCFYYNFWNKRTEVFKAFQTIKCRILIKAHFKFKVIFNINISNPMYIEILGGVKPHTKKYYKCIHFAKLQHFGITNVFSYNHALLYSFGLQTTIFSQNLNLLIF